MRLSAKIIFLLLVVFATGSEAQYGSFGNVSFSLDGTRGGQLGSIFVAGQGETLVNNADGQGLGTSGFLFDETGGASGGLWAESGCISNAGNSDVSFPSVWGHAVGIANTNTQWKDTGTPCPRVSPWKYFQIAHDVWFPTAYDGVLSVTQSVKNLTGQTVTLTQSNEGFNWPIAPQAHFDRARFLDLASGHGYWRIRQADGSWVDLGVVSANGWLATTDFYTAPGHAIAVYADSDHAWGVALHCGDHDNGFYAKDMVDAGIMFIGNVWTFTSPLGNNASADRTCQVVYGSEFVISGALSNF